MRKTAKKPAKAKKAAGHATTGIVTTARQRRTADVAPTPASNHQRPSPRPSSSARTLRRRGISSEPKAPQAGSTGRHARRPVDLADSAEKRAAVAAKLIYTTDEGPGIRRTGKPGRFLHVHADGRRVTDRPTLARIAGLVIPPAWTDVWICPRPNGHIQVTGRDARGRKQYRYHPRWRQVRDESKFNRMIEFAQALPRVRRAVSRDMRAPGLPRNKILAGVVRLLERTSIRVGNDEYARSNRHYGITTFEDRHARITGGTVRFVFRGKSGKAHEIDLHDPVLANLVRRCRDIPGQRLFQYFDEHRRRRNLGSADVNRYLRQISGADFTAKDFRTWTGTNMVAATLAACAAPRSAAAGNRAVLEAIDGAAAHLGNTRAVCRSSYVHPAVIDAFLGGRLQSPAGLTGTRASGRATARLSRLETATLRVLQAARKSAQRTGHRRGR